MRKRPTSWLNSRACRPWALAEAVAADPDPPGILGGAAPEAVAAAFDRSVAKTFVYWHEWATGQRDYGVTSVTEFAAVARVFAAAGVTVHEGSRRDRPAHQDHDGARGGDGASGVTARLLPFTVDGLV